MGAWNCIIGTPIYSDVGSVYTPVLSGGSWLGSLPLTNLQDRRLSKVARSSDALAASTTFDVDMGVARALRVAGLFGHNLSLSATIRIRGSNSAGSFGSPTTDTGTISVYDAGITAEHLADLESIDFVFAYSAVTTASRYWRIEITDTGNADGYVEIGRLALCGGWQPTINMEYGARLGLEDPTVRNQRPGGTAFFDSRRKARVAQFHLPNIPTDEALTNGFDIARKQGTSGQVVFVFDATDTTHMHRRSFLGTFRELTPLQITAASYWGVPMMIVEEL